MVGISVVESGHGNWKLGSTDKISEARSEYVTVGPRAMVGPGRDLMHQSGDCSSSRSSSEQEQEQEADVCVLAAAKSNSSTCNTNNVMMLMRGHGWCEGGNDDMDRVGT